MQNTENFETQSFQEEESINFRKVISIILNKWHLFLFCGLVGLMGGYVFSRYSQTKYQVDATIFVPQKTSSIGAGLENMFKSQFTNNKSEVYNQIEIIKSFNINNQVAQNLNWRTSWFKKDHLNLENLFKLKEIFRWSAYYKDAPFIVAETAGAYNTPGIRLYLTPRSATSYELSVDDDVTINGTKKTIHFETIGTYGKPLANDFFHFTITRKNMNAGDLDRSYCFLFNETSQIAEAYLKNLGVDLNDKQSDIIRLQLAGTQPEMDVDYLNQLISVYMQNKMSFQTETQKRSLLFIDKQLTGFSDSLKSASTNFSQFKARNKIVNIGEQGKLIMKTMQDVETDKNKNQMQLDYFRNMLNYLGKSSDAKQLIAPSVVGIQDASLNEMVLGLSELYSRRQILSFSAKENNPALVMIDKEIAQTNARLKENLRNLIRNAEVLNNAYKGQQNNISSQLNQLPQQEQDMIGYQRKFEMTNEIYTFLLQKRAEIDIALAGATPEVQVIDAARPETTHQVGMSSVSKILLGLLIGLAFPGLYLVILGFFANTIETQEDIEKNTHLPVLGNVIHSRSNSDTPVNDNPRSGIAESYRSIRTNLQFMLAGDNQKIIAIHSTNPGEGKSFTSVNLATILAMNNKKVILVGCDMRKPRSHKILNISNEHGLSTYLSGQDELKDIVFETAIANLSLLPGGPIPPNPSELLDQPELEQLLKTLSTQYDYVILDNAPVSLVTDGLLSGRHADLNVFILRYGISKKDQIQYINQVSENKLLSNLALVINDISGAGFGSGKNYYYGPKYSDNGNGYYEETEKSNGFLKRIFGKA